MNKLYLNQVVLTYELMDLIPILLHLNKGHINVIDVRHHLERKFSCYRVIRFNSAGKQTSSVNLE